VHASTLLGPAEQVEQFDRVAGRIVEQDLPTSAVV
jgi:hypothetical protein